MNTAIGTIDPPEPVIKGIDHLIVMAGDLDRSNGLWNSLGFSTTPRGFHDSGGTANHLILLDQMYIELLGLVDPRQASPYRSLIEDAAGIWGIALRGSAEAAFRFWTSQGLDVSAPVSLSRPVDINGRSERARFQLTMLARMPNLPFPIFCCEHLTPEFVWEPDRPPHPNGARALQEVVLIAADDRIWRQFELILGRPASIDGNRAAIQLGDCRLVFLPEAEFVHRFGATVAGSGARPPIAAITIATAVPKSEAENVGLPALTGSLAENLRGEGVVVEWVRNCSF